MKIIKAFFLLNVFFAVQHDAVAQIDYEYIIENVWATSLAIGNNSMLFYGYTPGLTEQAGPLFLLNSNDSVQWKRWVTEDNPDDISLLDAAPAADGGYFITGDHHMANNSYTYVQKIDSDGFPVWDFFIDHPGNYPVMLRSFGNDLLVFSGNLGNYCWKFRQDGSVVWQENIGNGSNQGVGYSKFDAQAISDTKFVALIRQRLAVYDSSGSVIWNINMPAQFDPLSVSVTSDGEFLVAGRIMGSFRPMVMKFDANGTTLWAKVYNYGVSAAHAMELANGNVLIQIDSAASGPNNIAFVKTNAAGEVLQAQKDYFADNCVGSLYRSPDGRICFAAMVAFYGTYMYNTYLLMSDDNFTLPLCYLPVTITDSTVNVSATSETLIPVVTTYASNSNFIGTLLSSPTSPLTPCLITGADNPAQQSLTLFPNPASGYLQVSWPSGKGGELKIIEPTGKVIYKTTSGNRDQSIVPLTTFAAGMYLAVWSNGSQTMSKKFVLEK